MIYNIVQTVLLTIFMLVTILPLLLCMYYIKEYVYNKENLSQWDILIFWFWFFYFISSWVLVLRLLWFG